MFFQTELFGIGVGTGVHVHDQTPQVHVDLRFKAQSCTSYKQWWQFVFRRSICR